MPRAAPRPGIPTVSQHDRCERAGGLGRRAPRVLEGTWSGSLQRGRIAGLSVAGCYIESVMPPDEGTRLQVHIELPQHIVVRVGGIVGK